MAKRKVKLFLYHDVYNELDVDEQVKSDPAVPTQSRRTRLIRTAIFCLLGVGILGVYMGFWFTSKALTLKDQLNIKVKEATVHVKTAQNALGDSRPEVAEKEFELAEKEFSEIQREIQKSGLLIRIAAKIHPKLRMAVKILEASRRVSYAGQKASNFAGRYQTISFDLAGSGTKGGVGDLLINGQAELSSLRAEVISANELLNTVNPDSFSSDEKGQVNELKDKVSRLTSLLGSLDDMVVVMRGFFTGDKHVLVLFQNNRELRSTGGFMGTYGRVILKSGVIKEIKVSSIYDLDGQMRQQINPPEPMYAINSRWFLRDVNWFANYPDSAKKISSFYEREGGETPDFVIALTPELVVRLLEITGPISLPAYNTTLKADNFVETTQFLTSVAYDKQLNTPKAMIADFLPLFLQKLFSLEGQERVRMLSVVSDVLAEKHILLFSRTKEEQAIFSRYNWAGELQKTNGDFLSINVSNLGGTKVDTDISQNVIVKSRLGSDGNIVNTVSITRINPLPKDKQYQSLAYIRAYVPEGSVLVSARGFSPTPYDLGGLVKSGLVDPDVAAIEQKSSIDFSSKTNVGVESGKTFFGNWMIVPGGASQEAELVYRLPFTYKDLTSHSLLAQIQSGLKPESFTYNFSVSPPWSIIKSSEQAVLTTPQDMTYSTNALTRDAWIGMVLSK